MSERHPLPTAPSASFRRKGPLEAAGELIGQSSVAIPARFSFCMARSLSASGSVLVSITMRLFGRFTAAIFSTASSSAATVASDVITTSALRATAVLEASGRPPAFFNRRRAAGNRS